MNYRSSLLLSLLVASPLLAALPMHAAPKQRFAYDDFLTNVGPLEVGFAGGLIGSNDSICLLHFLYRFTTEPKKNLASFERVFNDPMIDIPLGLLGEYCRYQLGCLAGSTMKFCCKKTLNVLGKAYAENYHKEVAAREEKNASV